ncbi:MAG: alpha/beta fold hydrolase [Desulfobacteraceae bacterium]|nr:alpha/beta fold hydrolase [Desulfobacteraceae bacterium]
MKKGFVLVLLSTILIWAGFLENSYAVFEGDFEYDYERYVMADYDTGEFKSFNGVDGVKIAYVKFDRLNQDFLDDNAYKGAIVIQHGDTESYKKYAELIYDLKILRQMGFQVFLMDLRGQGYSERMLNNKYKDYVEDYDDYVTDYTTFIDTIVQENNPPQLFAVSHSLGGWVTFRFMEDNPDTFDGAVLCSPMLKPWTGGMSENTAYKIAETAVKLGMGKLYALGESFFGETLGPRNKFFMKAKFEDNKVTTSEVRWTKWNDVLQENDNELDVNGHTFNWIYEAIDSSRYARDHENASVIKTPMVIFEAQNDLIVDTSVFPGICEAINNAGGNCDNLPFGFESKHELFMEQDILRDEVVNQTISFILDHSAY